MGAWSYIYANLKDIKINLISRAASPATATGSIKQSLKEQEDIIDKVFNKK